MRGLKLLISRYAKNRVWILISLLAMAVMLILVMVFHADAGAESTEHGDYMMCKIFALFPVILCADLPVIFMARETQGSRFMRATPYAERMYKTDIPVFSAVIAFAWIVLTVLVYSVFILVTGRDISNISDMLVIAAIMEFVFAIITCCVMILRYGAFVFIADYLPFQLLMVFMGEMDSGIGLPLWLAVLLLMAAFAGGLAVDLVISHIAYTRGNFREVTFNAGRIS